MTTSFRFSKTGQNGPFLAFLINCCPLKMKARFARYVEWDFFCGFQTLWCPLQNAFERNSSVTFSLVVCIFPIMVGRSSTFHNCLTFDFSDFDPFFFFFWRKVFWCFSRYDREEEAKRQESCHQNHFSFFKADLVDYSTWNM